MFINYQGVQLTASVMNNALLLDCSVNSPTYSSLPIGIACSRNKKRRRKVIAGASRVHHPIDQHYADVPLVSTKAKK